ncbi:TIGR01841 family phasin [Variovorax sp. RT4R15]|uniref:TIGR01841 family phasin n=1 Tax=Variovorax sp. RT4R15 TaxID=3443737 RepID=UPI003F465DDE
MTALATSTHTSVNTMFGLASKAFEGAETLVALNLQTLKTLMAESHENSRIASSTRSPAQLIQLQAETLQAVPLKALAYGRQVQEVFATFDAARRAAYEDGVADAQAKLLEAVNSFFKNAPGSEKIMALVQSAVDASNNAYKGLDTTSKQLSDTLTANATKVGETVAQSSSNALAKIEA